MSVESRRPSTDTRFDSVIIGRESKLNLEALKGRQFLHAPFVKCSVFKSLYSFVYSQTAYKISYFLIVQTLPPCSFLCCMSAMVASRWQCHH